MNEGRKGGRKEGRNRREEERKEWKGRRKERRKEGRKEGRDKKVAIEVERGARRQLRNQSNRKDFEISVSGRSAISE